MFCDKENEKQMLAILLGVAQHLKTYYHYEKVELAFQKEEADKLWELAQSYRTVGKETSNCNLYPDQSFGQLECELESQMYSHIINIRQSNKKIRESMEYFEPAYRKLDECAKQIYWMNHSNTMIGNCGLKILRNYVESVIDLKRNLWKRIVDRQVIQDMLNIQYLVMVEVYQELLEQQDEFNDAFAKAIFFTELFNM